ncbi:MAG: Na+/H+ antiporter NhaC family protein, partial [Peptostreptococcaceae bacterium]
HIDHVKTQIPYGVTVASVVFFILLLVGIFRLSPIVFIPLGIFILFMIVYIMNKINEKSLNSKKNSM